MSTISAYRKIMFGEKGVAGKTYYSALDTICNFDIDPVLFMDGKDAYHLTFEEYSNCAKNVEEAGEWFDKATVNHAFIQSPWYPINADFTGVDLVSDARWRPSV